MKIETKHDLGEKVYYVTSKLEVKKSKVSLITFDHDGVWCSFVTANMTPSREESEIFKTIEGAKEEAVRLFTDRLNLDCEDIENEDKN